MPGWLKTGLCRVLAVPSIHCVPVVPQFALIHNEDSVHHIDGEESVAAQNRRAFLSKLMKPFEELSASALTSCTRRLIQNKNLRVVQDGRGERHFLPFTNAPFCQLSNSLPRANDSYPSASAQRFHQCHPVSRPEPWQRIYATVSHARTILSVLAA
jgi:hypothetical protein